MPSPNAVANDAPPIGRRYDVGGVRLFLHQAGTGAPPAVFLPGAGMFGLGYYNVHALAAQLTTSVVYDRAGTGWSDAVELPRSARVVAEEFRSLLGAAGIPGPYLLVGHSLGGLFARRFAQLFPADVAAFLLLDPAHEDFTANMSEEARQFGEQFKSAPMPEFTAEMIAGFRPLFAQLYAAWPDSIREALIDRHVDPARFGNGLLEAKNGEELYEEVRHGGPVPVVPTIVYTATGIDASQTMFTPEAIVRAHNEAKLVTNAAYVRSVPGAEHRVLEDASHAMLHSQRPDAVVQGIRDLLARVRGLTPAAA